MEMETEVSTDVPLPEPLKTVGIIYNVKKGVAGRAPDEEAELDSIDTVYAISNSIKKLGIETVLLEADAELPRRLCEIHIDMAFNIAEGFHGRAREAQVPALLELLGIPYAGADQTALCVALDKELCKRCLSTFGIVSPRSALMTSADEPCELNYPVIVKPNAEGSGKGITEKSVAANETELREILRGEFALYDEPVLAEEYIPGREFTVGVLGNGAGAYVFAPMEIIYRAPTQAEYHVYSYKVKCNYNNYVDYKCPADIAPEIERELKETTLKAFNALGCRDFTRADFRVSPDGRVYFIEINPLPGLAPDYSDYPMLAKCCGVGYDGLIAGILGEAAKRCGFAIGE